LPAVGRGPLLYPEAFPLEVRPGQPPSPTTTEPGADTGTNAERLLDVPAGALADLAVRRMAAGGEFDGLEPLYLRRPDVAPAAPTKSTLG
jgi:hypothetical protein